MAVTVGAFILVTSLLFFLGVIYVVSEKGIFEKKYYYTLMAESGEDLAQGMPILFSGFEIGTVINMDLDDDGRVKLQIEIPEHQLRWVKSDSKFILDKPLIGSAKIMVITENLESETLDINQKRNIVTKDGINELVTKVQPVLDDLQAIAKNINMITSKESDLNQILHHLEGGTKEAKYVIQNANDKILGDNNSSIAKVNAILDDIALKVKSLDTTINAINGISEDLGGMKNDIKFTLKKTDQVVEGLNSLIGTSPSGEVELP